MIDVYKDGDKINSIKVWLNEPLTKTIGSLTKEVSDLNYVIDHVYKRIHDIENELARFDAIPQEELVITYTKTVVKDVYKSWTTPIKSKQHTNYCVALIHGDRVFDILEMKGAENKPKVLAKIVELRQKYPGAKYVE